MVLENSRDIQTATAALLSFKPECLEVTLQGSPCSVTLAMSKVVMLLDQLREQSRTDRDVCDSLDFDVDGHRFFGNLHLESLIGQNLNKDFTNKSQDLVPQLDLEEVTRPTHCESKNNIQSQNPPQKENVSQPDVNPIQPLVDPIQPSVKPAQPHVDLIQPNANSTELHVDYFNDGDLDSSHNPLKSTPIYFPDFETVLKDSADDDDSSSEENILTDPRYCKKFEKALKLGYSEKQVTIALTKRPECAWNDLLSELISQGAADSDLATSQPQSAESDFLLAHEDSKYGHFRDEKFSLTSSSASGDSSGFSQISDSNNVVDVNDSSNLRDIIIDGSNVAMSHGKKAFSCKGIQIAVNWFRERGHKNITAFVPQWRKETSRPDAPITDQDILSDLEKEGVLVFTPARRVKGRRVVCYDDRYVLKLAVETDGIVVSNDVYRDLVNEREDFQMVVEQRLLMYSFVNDRFMPPEDPLGRMGPTLDNFLRKVPAEPIPRPQDCPYGRKCTYGNKCRFYHPERGFAPQKSITDTLKEQADQKLQERATKLSEIAEKGRRSKQKLYRTKSLIPGELLSANSSQTSVGLKDKHEKPKFGHSKSVVFPTKSSDYLNEPRRKLEEAERAAACEKIVQGSLEQQIATQIFLTHSTTAETHPLPTSLAPPQRDVAKQEVASENTSKLRSPLASPSHLDLPIQDRQERYLSGHLYLAKKLSDESADNTFFTEYTTSPSSTRTSPVLQGGRKVEHEQSVHSMDAYEDSVRSFSLNPHLRHQQPLEHGLQSMHIDGGNIPNLSIFEMGSSLSSQSPEGNDASSTHRDENTGSVHFADAKSQRLSLRFMDSGLCTSCDSSLSTDTSGLECSLQMINTYPKITADQPHQSPEHVSLRQAFSTTGSATSSEKPHQKIGRRASGFSPTNLVAERTIQTPQKNTGKHQSDHLLKRSPDAQMLNFDSVKKQPSVQSPISSSDESADVFTHAYPLSKQYAQQTLLNNDENQQIQSLQQQHYSQLQQHQKFQQLQQQQFQQQPSFQQQHHSPLFSVPHLPQAKISTWGEPIPQANLAHRSSLGGAIQTPYNPLQNLMTSYNPGLQPHLMPITGNPNLISSTYNHSPSRINPPLLYQHSVTYPTPYTQIAPTIPHTPRRQSFPCQPGYSQIPFNTGNSFGSNHSQRIPTGFHSSSFSFISSEDAPIVPNDPRFSLYYHLGIVFGEEVVRRVMNLNPGVLDPIQLCKLIEQYKEDQIVKRPVPQ